MTDCRCHKLMLAYANEGVCVWCGHGDCLPARTVRLRRRRRVARDLAALNREGRTPRTDGSCAYVVPAEALAA